MAIVRYAGDRIVCLSTDTFPSDVADGAVLFTADTNAIYLKNAGAWTPISAGGGGGASTGYVLGISGVLATSIFNTGATLSAALATDIANLTTTGATLDARITGLSGALTVTGASLDGRLYSTGVTLLGVVNPIPGNLTATGATLDARITGLSGAIAATGASLNTRLTTVESLTTSLSNRLYFTGLYLGGWIIASSGNTFSTGAANYTGLYNTGQLLMSRLLDVSGMFVGGGSVFSTGSILNDRINILSGNLAATGSTLYGYIVGLSGAMPTGGGGGGGTGVPNPITLNSGQNALTLFNKVYCGRNIPTWAGGNGEPPYPSDSPYWHYKNYSLVTNTSTSMSSFGINITTSASSITHVSNPYYGYMANFATATAIGSVAGAGFGAGILYRGTGDITGGFLFATVVGFPDVIDNRYLSGAVSGSGVRIFVGVSNAASVAATVNANFPTGVYAGFRLIRGSGGTQPGLNDTNFQFIVKNNSTPYTIDTNVPLNSGLYKMMIYSPPQPYDNSLFWYINNHRSGVVASGVVYVSDVVGGLPSGNVALRPYCAICNLAPQPFNLRMSYIYAEVPSYPLV